MQMEATCEQKQQKLEGFCSSGQTENPSPPTHHGPQSSQLVNYYPVMKPLGKQLSHTHTQSHIAGIFRPFRPAILTLIWEERR